MSVLSPILGELSKSTLCLEKKNVAWHVKPLNVCINQMNAESVSSNLNVASTQMW